ncbi:MAG: multidrug efflux SMR transporter [Vicinamibacterales bacterium]|nr:multidrug efflux SMR transporter [Vicinamibacterales bacterium]
MAWGILVVAALFEIAWAVGLKATEGFTRPVATVVVIVCLILSVTLLGMAARTLPIGTAYAVWTGIGAIGTAAIGILWLNEPATLQRLGALAMIVGGIVWLKAAS